MALDREAQWNDLPIKHLVLATKDFVVFVDNEYYIDWKTTPAYDKIGAKDKQAHNAIMNDAAFLEATPCDHLSKSLKLDFKRLIAEAIASSFKHDYPNARKMLIAAQNFVSARNQEKSRFWYLSASGATASIATLSGLALWIWRNSAMAILGEGAFLVSLSAVAGALGALLSIIMLMGKSELDCSSGRELHYMEGASRIIAGSISGLLLVLAVKAGVVLPALATVRDANWGMLLGSFVAGSSERWAPSIMSRLGASSDTRIRNAKGGLSAKAPQLGETP